MVVVFTDKDKATFPYQVDTQILYSNTGLVDAWLDEHMPDSGIDGDRSLWLWISNADGTTRFMMYRFKYEHDALQFALTFT